MVKNSYIVLLLPVALLSGFMWFGHGTTPSAIPGDTVEAYQSDAVPSMLSSSDRKLYQNIFQAQKNGDWKQADAAIRQVKDPLLMGHVLADRYLSHRYQPTSAQLTDWLSRYGDHPQTTAIYDLALASAPKDALPAIRKPAMLSGYGNGALNLRFASTDQAAHWQRGIQAWSAGRKTEAAAIFVNLSDNTALSSAQRTAAAYWAYRSLVAIDDPIDAKKYLRRAATDSHSFYGIIARKQLGIALTAGNQSSDLDESDVLTLTGDPTVRRAVALTQVGASDIAERELRVAFPQADEQDKLRLLALARELRLASVQISMAKELRASDHSLDFALYPIPHWQPKNGFKIDPSLLFALARQESGFRATAVSPDGAMGLMQLMPKTASMMQKISGAHKDNASDPSSNLALGQGYVLHLLDNALVDGNLIYMLTAYNAGPGKLQEWKREFSQADPLLFIESIPYGETRAYIMQVMTNYWMYSELAGDSNRSIAALIKGTWPNYSTSTPVASRMSLGQAG